MGMIPMIAPDGSVGEIPKDKVQDAVSAGFKLGFFMKAPDGSTGVIPRDRAGEAETRFVSVRGNFRATHA